MDLGKKDRQRRSYMAGPYLFKYCALANKTAMALHNYLLGKQFSKEDVIVIKGAISFFEEVLRGCDDIFYQVAEIPHHYNYASRLLSKIKGCDDNIPREKTRIFFEEAKNILVHFLGSQLQYQISADADKVKVLVDFLESMSKDLLAATSEFSEIHEHRLCA